MDILGKSFILRHVFENVSSMENNTIKSASVEEHFGALWCVFFFKRDQNYGICVQCDRGVKNDQEYSINADCGFRLTRKSGESRILQAEATFNLEKEKRNYGIGFSNFLEEEETIDDYLVNDGIIVETVVTIKMTTGIHKANLRSFEDPQLSDMVLIAKDRKFHVSKLFLASQSTYFKPLFLGNYEEFRKSEVTLNGVDPDDFQKFLEVLYGDPAIDDDNVEGIVLIADMYDTKNAFRKCEEFLMKDSKKLLKKKFQMALRYGLKDLKEYCFKNMNTGSDVRLVMPADLADIDRPTLEALFKKALTFVK